MRWFLLCLLLLPATAQAQSLVRFADVVRFSAGIQGAWYDEEAFPSDFEIGGTVAASLQPHISAVGGAFYGVGETYLRGSLGGRYTVTDVDNPRFSVGLGASYHGGSEPSVLPEEWVADASFGWRPAASITRLIVVGQGGYGFTTSKARGLLGLRWQLPL